MGVHEPSVAKERRACRPRMEALSAGCKSVVVRLLLCGWCCAVGAAAIL